MTTQVPIPVVVFTETLLQPFMALPPSEKVMIPPSGAGLTFTVKVTCWPTVEGLAEELRTLVVEVGLGSVGGVGDGVRPVMFCIPENESTVESPNPGFKPLTTPGESCELPFIVTVVPSGAALKLSVLPDPLPPSKVKPPVAGATNVLLPPEVPMNT